MSTAGVQAFIEKALNDEGFQAEFKADPDKAMSQFDLTEREMEAIKHGSEDQLQSLGLDARLTK